MPDYRYLTTAENGRFVWKTASASNAAALERELLDAEIPVLDVEMVEGLEKRSVGRVPHKEKLMFLEQLETAFYVGMPLTRALELSAADVRHKGLRKALDAIRADLEGGLPLSRAVSRWPGVFGSLENALISAGDEAGIMSQALQQINHALRRSLEISQRISSLLLYPKIVVVVLIVVVGILVGFTLPKFEAIFAASNVALPALTRWLLGSSRFLGEHPLMGVSMFGGAVAVFLALPKILRGFRPVHGWLLRMPVFGPVMRRSLACTFCRTFSQLLNANVPLLQALLLCRDISWNAYYRKCVAEACLLVSTGRSITAAMEPMRPVLGGDVLGMLSFGERAGSISQLLDPLAERMDRDLSLLVERMKPAIEAGVTVLIAAVIGTILVAALLPMFDMVRVFSVQ
jgi:type IV pilus assembly protein PilC